MTTLNGKIQEFTTVQVSHLTEVAETIRDDALAVASEKLRLFYSPGVGRLLERRNFLEYFKYELARGVAAVLAANDQNIRAVYIQDTVSNPDNDIAGELPLDVTVSLIAEVTVTSAALKGFISSLDRTLLASLKELGSPLYAQRDFILDVIVVTEDEIRFGTGYAHMLKSVIAPPLKVWQREG